MTSVNDLIFKRLNKVSLISFFPSPASLAYPLLYLSQDQVSANWMQLRQRSSRLLEINSSRHRIARNLHQWSLLLFPKRSTPYLLLRCEYLLTRLKTIHGQTRKLDLLLHLLRLNQEEEEERSISMSKLSLNRRCNDLNSLSMKLLKETEMNSLAMWTKVD